MPIPDKDPLGPGPRESLSGAQPDTASLAKDAKSGQTEAFGALYRKIQLPLIAWAHLRVRPRLSRSLSPEDLVHDVWLRAQQILKSYPSELVPFRAWIFSVAKHVLYEAQRRHLNSNFESSEGGDSERRRWIEQVPDDVTAQTQRLMRSEDTQALLTRLRSLEVEDRRLLLHCGLEDLPVRVAAERMGIGLDAANKRWQRLRVRLREWTLPEGFLVGS